MRCQGQNSVVWCSQVFQAVLLPVWVPWMAAWYDQLSGLLEGSAFIALTALR